MDMDIKELLQANLKMATENNNLLRKVYKVQRRAQIFKIIYWIFVIAIALGAFYYINLFIPQFMKFYNSVGGLTTSFPDISHLADLLNQIKK